jgi:hypothetical protein
MTALDHLYATKGDGCDVEINFNFTLHLFRCGECRFYDSASPAYFDTTKAIIVHIMEHGVARHRIPIALVDTILRDNRINYAR